MPGGGWGGTISTTRSPPISAYLPIQSVSRRRRVSHANSLVFSFPPWVWLLSVVVVVPRLAGIPAVPLLFQYCAPTSSLELLCEVCVEAVSVASGGIELILSIKAIHENTVPPTINLETPDPECDLDYTPNTPKKRQLNIAMSNSFGFGGHNASVLIGRLRD